MSNSSGQTQPPAQNQAPAQTNPTTQSHPSAQTQPPAQTHPTTQSHPSNQTQPPVQTHPTTQSHPSAQTQPPAQTHPTTQSHPSTQTQPSSQTHHSSPFHSSAQHHTGGHSHKITVEHFIEAVNGNHLNHLDKLLDANVEKSLDSQVVYKDLKEAREYYTKEHAHKKTAHWKIIHFPDVDEKENTVRARLTYDNKTYHTTYKFNSSGKIQRIDTTLDKEQHAATTHQ